MERMNEHIGLISSYQLLITAACTDTGCKMKGSHSRSADLCPFVLRHSLSQVSSCMQLGMLWYTFLTTVFYICNFCLQNVGHLVQPAVYQLVTKQFLLKQAKLYWSFAIDPGYVEYYKKNKAVIITVASHGRYNILDYQQIDCLIERYLL